MGNRNSKQCRERYVNHLQPDIKKGHWTEEEDNTIIRLQSEMGNAWSTISAYLVEQIMPLKTVGMQL